jgi:hypothetical protein
MNQQNRTATQRERRAWRMPNLPRLAAAILLAAAVTYLAVLMSSTDYAAYEARMLRSQDVPANAAAGDSGTPRVSERPAKNRWER